jgi:hypothetical protein
MVALSGGGSRQAEIGMRADLDRILMNRQKVKIQTVSKKAPISRRANLEG